MPGEPKKTNSSAKTSDQLVEELLKSVRGRDKEPKKEKKHHKHKKEKKSKHKHRSRSRERKKSKKRDRSLSKSKDRQKDKKRRHSSTSRSSFDGVKKKDSPKETSTKRLKPEDDRLSPVPSCSPYHDVEDDDLPVGADFQTVLEEARKPGKPDSTGPPLDLSLLPCEPGQSHRKRDFDNFPLAKERSKSPERKKESEILKKVIDEKGPGDFIPRNVMLKTKEKEPERSDSPHSILIDVHPKAIFFNIKTNVIETKTEVKKETKVTKEEAVEEKIVIEETVVDKTVEVMEVDEYGPAMSIESAETIEVENVVGIQLPAELPPEPKEEPVETKTTPVEEIKLQPKNNNEWDFTVKPLTTASQESNGKVKKKKKESKEKKEKRKSRSRSPDRSRSRKHSKSKEKKRARSVSRSQERRKRSPSREVRRRSRGRDHRRARSRSYDRDRERRRSWSRGRRSRSRSRGREESRIDKAKLLEIAKKRRAAGIFNIGDPNPKSVEDFVSYCEKLQKGQDREDRRARGEVVSDNESEIAGPSFKPYKSAAPFNDSITINIMNSVSLPTKSSEECILDTAALRVVYPVSSGQVHRENMEWQKVEKEAPLMTASTVQKNFKAMSSLDAERVRQKAKQLEQAPAFMLPPPPAPPALPPPPVPPKITVEDTLMPAPPPVPATLIIPPKEKLIIKEPEQISAVPPKNVAEVLAKRAKAQRVLQEDPNDFYAMRDLKDANEQMTTWAQLKSLPGKFTGTTGVEVMSADELQPHDPRGHAWVRKDMFKQLAPNFGGGIGLRMMERMGWRPGTGLGRECTGSLEPLTLDVKNDRKGLATEEDLPARSNKNLNRIPGTDLTGKHPVSLVMEMCAKRKWQSPIFTCMETGPSHQREFVWRAVVNGVEYCSATASRNKKDGKSIVCQVVLQSMGLVPRDPTLPVLI